MAMFRHENGKNQDRWIRYLSFKSLSHILYKPLLNGKKLRDSQLNVDKSTMCVYLTIYVWLASKAWCFKKDILTIKGAVIKKSINDDAI